MSDTRFSCELFYRDGGHSGPFHTVEDARDHARRYLASRDSGRVTACVSTTDRCELGCLNKLGAGPQALITGETVHNPSPVFAAWGCLA